MQGFFFGNETQLLLVAIPEATTVPFWLAVAALGLAATRRRR
jgi:MYXO-CTERM domain-containing protein